MVESQSDIPDDCTAAKSFRCTLPEEFDAVGIAGAFVPFDCHSLNEKRFEKVKTSGNEIDSVNQARRTCFTNAPVALSSSILLSYASIARPSTCWFLTRTRHVSYENVSEQGLLAN